MARLRLSRLALLLAAAAAPGCGTGQEPAGPAPAVPSQPPIARFASLDGRVEVKAFGTLEWRTADPQRVLARGDTVRTAAGGSAEIRFFDGTLVRVRPDSLITVEESSVDPTTRSRKVAWRISSGEVNFETARRAPPGSSTVVSTPTIRTTTSGDASAVIRVAQSGESEVRMFRGGTSVETSAGHTVEVGSGQTLRVDASGQPGAARTLPPPPRAIAPPDAAELAVTDPASAVVRLVWSASRGATAYRLEVDVQGAFTRRVIDRAGIRGTSSDIEGLPPGRYRWRVAGIAEGGVEGDLSSPSHFAVAISSAPPRLSVALDRRDSIVQISGETDPGARVTVDGHPVDVRADGTFREFLAVPAGSEHEVVVRATGSNGKATELRRALAEPNRN